jgi:outer membrane protein TolC
MNVGASIQINRIARTAQDPATAQSLLVFSLAQPLLRGRGASATAAAESAAKLDAEVSLQQARQTTAQRLRDACLAYFAYGAAYQSVTRWMEAEQRAKRLLDEEERLVRASEHPAADLKLLAANLADVSASRSNAEQLALEARQRLGVAMGLSWDEIERIGAPADDFVHISMPSALSGDALSQLIKTAWESRPDVLAADLQVRSADIRAYAARRTLLPKLDLQANLGYAGLSEGNGAAPFFTAPYERVSGVNFLAGLSLEYPLQNNAARGELAQRDAESKRAELIRDNLKRQIGAALALVSSTLRTALITLQNAEASVAAYREAVENERKKVRAGLTTLFDVIQIEGRLNLAEQNLLTARARVAALTAQLRYESGTMLIQKGKQFAVSPELLATPPAPR